MDNFRRMSVKAWMRVLGDALEDAVSRPPQWSRRKLLKRLNQQHGSIRAWDLGSGVPARPTDGNGWRLLK